MHSAYAVIMVTPVLIAVLAGIGAICWAVGQYRAVYLWNKADTEHDAVDTSKYYVAMLFSASEKLEQEQQVQEEEVIPSLEELADMAHDLAEVAENEYQQWIDSLEADIEYQEREERRIAFIKRHQPRQVTFGAITLTPVGTTLGVGAVG